MASHNDLSKRLSDIRQTMQAEALLVKGTTFRDMAADLGVSDKQARRIVAMLRELGCEIPDNFNRGTQEAVRIKLTANRLFRRHV
jgi:predicted DNA-binding transcriptional regulator YafY